MSAYPAVKFVTSANRVGQLPPDNGAEVSVSGRSNAGKSSAINALTQRKALARTSKTPGQTRLLNYFELAPGQRIVDLPGYGYASAPPAERAKWAPLIDRLRARQSLRGLFLIVDARRGMAEEDEGLMAWAGPAERRVHVLLTKADKLTRNEARAVLVAAERQLAGRATAQLLSAHSGAGVPEAQRALLAML
mgnify:CR=1 FL=1